MQSITLMVRKFPGEDALNFAYRGSELAVLIFVGQLAMSYFAAEV
jgi:hypothetical protein